MKRKDDQLLCARGRRLFSTIIIWSINGAWLPPCTEKRHHWRKDEEHFFCYLVRVKET